MDTNSLETSIRIHNSAYRNGTPFIGDEEYDQLLSQHRSVVGILPHETFLRMLTEVGGDVAHKFVIGSLRKAKHATEDLYKYLISIEFQPIFCTEKIDGMSFVATYINGIFTSGASRGDGFTGINLTDKLIHILPTKINTTGVFTLRGELTLTGDNHIRLGFKNRRNGTIGLIGRDNISTDELKMVKAITYRILEGDGSARSIQEQLKTLEELGFSVPSNIILYPMSTPNPGEAIGDMLCTFLTTNRSKAIYNIDGVVVCPLNYAGEDVFLPEKMIAYKINQDAVQATVVGIEWNISKQRLLKPVVLVTPTEIDGTTVSRVTSYNAQWVLDNGIGEVSVVGIVKSGEIIPKIVDIYKTTPVVLPDECPSCGTILGKTGVDLICTNKHCSAAGVKEVESFLMKMNVDGAKATTIENLGIKSIDDLLDWTPDKQYKSQNSLYEELSTKIFNAPAVKLFTAMRFDGFGRKMVNKLLDHYGSYQAATVAVKEVATSKTRKEFSLPEGFTSWNITKAAPSWESNLIMLDKICTDPRYQAPEEKVLNDNLAGKSFLFTGTLTTPRKQAEALVLNNGGVIASSVSKNLSYLIAGDSAGSKLDKANKLGVTVLSEVEFKNMVSACK